MSEAIKAPESKLVTYIKKAFPDALRKKSVATLGDRSQYIGSSDIGGCLRKAYLSKIEPKEADLEQLIVFQRGHAVEDIMGLMLETLNPKRQVETEVLLDSFPVRTHIDFLIESATEMVVVEGKSVSSTIAEPYHNWVLQAQLQMGGLKATNQTKTIRSYVLAVNINTGWIEAFDIPFSQILYDEALRRAGELITAIKTGTPPEAEEQLYCSKCAYKGVCPKMAGNLQSLPEDAAQTAKKILEFNRLKKEVDEAKENLQAFMEAAGLKKGRAGDLTVTLQTNKGRAMIDETRLKAEMPEVANMFTKDGSPYSFIKVA